MGRCNALDFLAGGAAVRSEEPGSWRRRNAVVEQSTSAALDDAISTANVVFFRYGLRTRLCFLLEFQMV